MRTQQLSLTFVRAAGFDTAISVWKAHTGLTRLRLVPTAPSNKAGERSSQDAGAGREQWSSSSSPAARHGKRREPATGIENGIGRGMENGIRRSTTPQMFIAFDFLY
jgi:hypothetical protein